MALLNNFIQYTTCHQTDMIDKRDNQGHNHTRKMLIFRNCFSFVVLWVITIQPMKCICFCSHSLRASGN